MTEELRLPSKWDDWNVKELIGEGSFGSVYLVERKTGDRTINSAVKVITIPVEDSEMHQLMRELRSEASVRLYYEDMVNDCLKEIQAMEALKGITNIVSIEDYLIEEQEKTVGWTIYIRMEYLKNFSDYYAEKQLDEKEILKMGIDICTALEYCEKDNILHRDIKPDNIFVSKHGSYKLGDFGVARQLDRTMGSFSSKGTFAYMAPEVYHGERYGAGADIYSLGLVLYKLLNNNRGPFLDTEKQIIYYKDRDEAMNRRMKGEKIEPPVGASPVTTKVLLKALEYNPTDRYASAAEMREGLEKAVAALENNTNIQKPEKKPKSKVMVWAAGFVAVLAIIVSVLVHWKNGQEAVKEESQVAENNAETEIESEEVPVAEVQDGAPSGEEAEVATVEEAAAETEAEAMVVADEPDDAAKEEDEVETEKESAGDTLEEEVQAKEESAVEEEPQAEEEPAVEEKAQDKEETSVEEEAQIEEELSVEEETPVEEEISVEENSDGTAAAESAAEKVPLVVNISGTAGFVFHAGEVIKWSNSGKLEELLKEAGAELAEADMKELEDRFQDQFQVDSGEKELKKGDIVTISYSPDEEYQKLLEKIEIDFQFSRLSKVYQGT